jgi:hypothetical protein
MVFDVWSAYLSRNTSIIIIPDRDPFKIRAVFPYACFIATRVSSSTIL